MDYYTFHLTCGATCDIFYRMLCSIVTPIAKTADGANDLGGTLMEETISRVAGAQNGSLKAVAQLQTLANALGRPACQRSTTDGEVRLERQSAAASCDEAPRRQLKV